MYLNFSIKGIYFINLKTENKIILIKTIGIIIIRKENTGFLSPQDLQFIILFI